MTEIYTISTIIAIATFSLTTYITPGPTNIILLSSVLTFGYKRSLPFMLANIFSYTAMIIVIGLGVGIFLTKHPLIMSSLKIVGACYLCWMAWKIANDTRTYDADNSTQAQPLSFLQSVAYPWLNPKAWIVNSSAISLFLTSEENSLIQISIIVLFIFLAAIISHNVWALGGVILKRFMHNKELVKRFNQVMAVLLVVSIIPVLI